MKTETFKIFINEKLGEVSAELTAPGNPKGIMTLAHGAGAGMNQSFMSNLARALSECGIASVRFNLHYMEHKKKRPDFPAIAHTVIQAAINEAETRYPSLPLIVSGKSFGGRMSSQLLAKGELDKVRALVFYGFPLHPANNPSIDRAEHLKDVAIPMLFLQGTKDALADLNLLQGVINGLPLATLELIEGADHSFKIGKKEAIVDLSKKTENWLQKMNIL